MKTTLIAFVSFALTAFTACSNTETKTTEAAIENKAVVDTNTVAPAPVFSPAENLPVVFNTNGLPATFIFDEKGEWIKVNNGMDDYDTEAYVQLLK